MHYFVILASTVSSQLLMTTLVVTWIDVGMATIWVGMPGGDGVLLGGLVGLVPGSLGWVIVPFVFLPIRIILLYPKLSSDHLLTMKGGNGLSTLFPIQVLHLPSSKV